MNRWYFMPHFGIYCFDVNCLATSQLFQSIRRLCEYLFYCIHCLCSQQIKSDKSLEFQLFGLCRVDPLVL